jgi:carbon monoxide dehydrogenase subunit G
VKLESTFDVPAGRQQAWDLLMDVPRIVPCMPGATLKETVSENEWRAEMAVKLGPIALTFDTTVVRESVDEANSSVVLRATAKEKRARGRAQATIESSLTEVDGGTRVDIVTDVTLAGALAQYGRGVVADVSEQMVEQFAACLRDELASQSEGPEAAGDAPVAPAPVPPRPRPPAKPVSGLRVGLRALLRTLGRSLRGLFRRPAR